MDNNLYYVYTLIDPRTQQPFYVGKGKGDRCRHHLDSRARGENKRKDRLIEDIRAAGHEPQIAIIQSNLEEENAYILEEQLIIQHGRKGLDDNGILMNFCLSNRPPCHKGLKRSEATKAKHRNRKHSEATKKKLSEDRKGKKGPMFGKPGPNRGKQFTEEHRERLRLAHLGLCRSTESKEKQSKSMKGRKPSSQTLAAANNARKGISPSDAWVSKIVASRKANGSYQRSPESIRKMLETRAKRKALNPTYGIPKQT